MLEKCVEKKFISSRQRVISSLYIVIIHGIIFSALLFFVFLLHEESSMLIHSGRIIREQAINDINNILLKTVVNANIRKKSTYLFCGI